MIFISDQIWYFEISELVAGTCHSCYSLSKGPKIPSPNIVAQSLIEASLFSPGIPENNIVWACVTFRGINLQYLCCGHGL